MSLRWQGYVNFDFSYLSEYEVPVGLCGCQLRVPHVGLTRREQHHGVFLEYSTRRGQVVPHGGILELVLALGGLVHEVLRRHAETFHALHELRLGTHAFKLENIILIIYFRSQ